jgi:hypothetical protein
MNWRRVEKELYEVLKEFGIDFTDDGGDKIIEFGKYDEEDDEEYTAQELVQLNLTSVARVLAARLLETK